MIKTKKGKKDVMHIVNCYIDKYNKLKESYEKQGIYFNLTEEKIKEKYLRYYPKSTYFLAFMTFVLRLNEGYTDSSDDDDVYPKIIFMTESEAEDLW